MTDDAKHKLSRTTTLAALTAVALVSVALAGCHEPLGDEEIVLAFTHRDTDLEPDKDPERLARWVEEQTGIPTTIYTIDSENALIEALNRGHAHAAFMDGGAAWISWQLFGFDAIAADQKGDGRTYYNAQAWVLNESAIQDYSDLQGTTSCHTGLLKSAGMFMPMGYLIRENYITQELIESVGDPDDVSSIEAVAKAFFDEPSIPTSNSERYGNYIGAFRCLSEGAGDVAFVRDTSWDEHCSGDDAPAWCLPREAYRTLEPPFGAVPSHPVMVGPETSPTIRTQLADALVALNDSGEGQAILSEVLETPGITRVTTEGHLGDYSANLQHIPGLAEYYQDQLGLQE